jgi:thiosulfate/3-mercaptopyruvate sulfurtransferase
MTATYRNLAAIISTAELSAALGEDNLRVFDCTTYLDPPTADTKAPYTVRSGRADYDAGHIPGAGFVDLQGTLSDPDGPAHLRFTMPSPSDLAMRLKAIGVGDGTRVVLYSRGNMQWATRVWWMLYAIGFDDTAVLDGGWDKWIAEERAVDTQPVQYAAALRLTVKPRPRAFAGRDEMLAAIDDNGSCTINALSADLHSGDNPRYGRPGRIPGSINVPAAALQDPSDKRFPSPADALAHFESAGLGKGKRALVYCGGGIAATLDAFLLLQLGYDDVAVYDASMSEWAKDDSLPIEVG